MPYNDPVNKRVMPRMFKMFLALQQALLGAVTSRMRAVYVDFPRDTLENELTIYFVFHEESTEEDQAEIKTIVDRVQKEFPLDRIIIHKDRIDFPHPDKYWGCGPVFRRAGKSDREPMIPCSRVERIVFSTMRELYKAWTPNVRAIFIDWEEEEIYPIFVFDGTLSEEDIENICLVQMIASMDFEEEFMLEIPVRIDMPNPIPWMGKVCIYQRKEVLPCKHSPKLANNVVIDQCKDPKRKIFFSAQQALLGSVTYQMREVTVDVTTDEITFYFVFNSEYDQEDLDEIAQVVQRMQKEYPHYCVSAKHFRVEHPLLVHCTRGSSLYCEKTYGPYIREQDELSRKDRLMIASMYILDKTVTSNLRSVFLDFDATRASLSFIYDGAPSEEEEKMCKEACNTAPYHLYENRGDITSQIFRIDYPEPLPNIGTACVYRRKEKIN